MAGAYYLSDKHDYSIAIWKEDLLKIKEGNALRCDLFYWSSDQLLTTKGEFLLCLLTNQGDVLQKECEIIPFPEDAWKIGEKIVIKEGLLEAWLNHDLSTPIEYRYDAHWNKIHLYLNESREKEDFEWDLDFYGQYFELKHQK